MAAIKGNHKISVVWEVLCQKVCRFNIDNECQCGHPKKVAFNSCALNRRQNIKEAGRTVRAKRPERIWIVEAHFTNGCDVWEPCTFGIGEFASNNFYKAHRIKRLQQEYLQKHGSREWYKNKFRVVEYVPWRDAVEVNRIDKTSICGNSVVKKNINGAKKR